MISFHLHSSWMDMTRGLGALFLLLLTWKGPSKTESGAVMNHYFYISHTLEWKYFHSMMNWMKLNEENAPHLMKRKTLNRAWVTAGDRKMQMMIMLNVFTYANTPANVRWFQNDKFQMETTILMARSIIIHTQMSMTNSRQNPQSVPER